MKTLLVIIPDRLSVLIRKGEITDRYYNPGNLFKEVHILMTNDDQPDHRALQRTVGDAELFLHNLPFTKKDVALASIGPRFLHDWARPAIELAQRIQPHLVRCYSDGLNGFVAYTIKQAQGIPYIVSLHNNPDEKLPARSRDLKTVVTRKILSGIKKITISNADFVLPVYKSITPYANRMGAKHVQVIYNFLNNAHLKLKADYSLHHPARIISVGRLFASKNPVNLIRAIRTLADTQLTLVGDGPIQTDLERVARGLGISDRVRFIHSLQNDDVCDLLTEQDIFAIHSDHAECAKTTMEAMLTSLPCVINQRNGSPVPELQGGQVRLVENSAKGYADAIRGLMQDDQRREAMGRLAYTYARDHWEPNAMEAKYAEVYGRIIAQTNA